MPAYRPLAKVIKPVHKQIQVWPEGSSEALQDCFDITDWDMFKQAATYNNTTDLQEYSETVYCLHHQVYWWCNGHKDYHCPGQPEAVADRGGLQTPEGSERCLQSWRWGGLKTARANLSPRHQRGQETVLQEDSPSFQQQQRHSEPVVGDTDHYGLQAPTTDLWQHHPPSERAECLPCSLWGTKQHHCTEGSTSSRRPGDNAVPGQREEIPQQDQCTQSSRSWQHSWACTERLCSGTHWCFHRHFSTSH